MKYLAIGAMLAIGGVLIINNAFGQCTPGGCVVGPCISSDLMIDPSFDTGCTNWKYQYSAQRVRFNNEWSGQVDHNSPSGRIYQDVAFNVGNSPYEMIFQLEVEKCSPGAETLYVEIHRVSDNALLETVAVLPATTTSSGTFDYYIGNYNGQTVRVMFRQVGGTGDTEFRIRWVNLWASLY
jgi:hypothetical protein